MFLKQEHWLNIFFFIILILIISNLCCTAIPANPDNISQVDAALKENIKIKNLSYETFSLKDWIRSAVLNENSIIQNLFVKFYIEEVPVQCLSINFDNSKNTDIFYKNYLDEKKSLVKTNSFATDLGLYSLKEFTIGSDIIIIWKNNNWIFIINSKNRKIASDFKNDLISVLSQM